MGRRIPKVVAAASATDKPIDTVNGSGNGNDTATDITYLTSILGRGNYGRLSRICGIDRSHISRVLRGENEASLQVASMIADAAGVTLDDLRAYISYQNDIQGR